MASVEFVAANLRNVWGWTEKSIGDRQARRSGELIVTNSRYLLTPV
jgi:hypothetical protein